MQGSRLVIWVLVAGVWAFAVWFVTRVFALGAQWDADAERARRERDGPP